MAKTNPKRDDQWVNAKRRCRLSAEQLRRAKEMGLNPVKLIKNIPAPTQQWKQPVGDWIDEMYSDRQTKAARIERLRSVAQPWPEAAEPPRISTPPSARAAKAKKRPSSHSLSSDPLDYRIRLTAELFLSSAVEDSYLLKYTVTLLGNENRNDRDAEEPHYVRVGSLKVWLFRVEAYQEKMGYRLFDLFDADSDEAMQLFEAVFDDESEEPKESLGEAGLISLPVFGSDILHFQWGDLPPEYRRSNVVLSMVERVIDALGGGCFAATLWPWDSPIPDPEKSTGAEVSAFFESQQANEDHWGKIGFRRIPGTVILIRDLNREGWDTESLMEGKYGGLDASNTASGPPGAWKDTDEIF